MRESVGPLEGIIIMNPISEKKEKKRSMAHQKEEVLHLKRMVGLEEAKQSYLQRQIQGNLKELTHPQLMELYQYVCELADSQNA